MGSTWLEQEGLAIINDTSGRFDERDREAAAEFVDHHTRAWADAGTQFANDSEARLTARQDDLYQQIRSNQRQADANRQAMDDGKMAVEEFVAANQLITARRQMLERIVDGFESHAASIDDIRTDPAGWYDAFLAKWPRLHQQRPDIHGFLVTRKTERGERERAKLRAKRS